MKHLKIKETKDELYWIPKPLLDAIATYFLVKENGDGWFKVKGLKNEVLHRMSTRASEGDCGLSVVPGLVVISKRINNAIFLTRVFSTDDWRTGGRGKL